MLRQLREESGYTLKTAGSHLERSPSSLSQIENGIQWLRLRDLGFILDRYLVTPEALDRVSLEYNASRIITAETSFIPGLLQTESYALAIYSGLARTNPQEAERYVAFRLARQQIMHRVPATPLEVILDEAVLRRMRGGPQVMRSQLRRLLNESEQDHIRLQVLPLAVDPGPAYVGQLQLIEVGSPLIVEAILADHYTGQWILETDEDVTQYREKFGELSTSALDLASSRELINTIISEL